jgi:hypothetical protein
VREKPRKIGESLPLALEDGHYHNYMSRESTTFKVCFFSFQLFNSLSIVQCRANEPFLQRPMEGTW